MRDLAADGGEFADHLPDDLPCENAPTGQPCLALTPTARVDRSYLRPVPARPVDARDPRVEGEAPMTWEPYTPEQLAELAATEPDDATEPDGDAELDGDVHDPDCSGIHQGAEGYQDCDGKAI